MMFEASFDFDESERAPRIKQHNTVALKTLRRPKVATLRDALSYVDEEKILFAEDADLEELLQLYQHEHPKVKAAASTVLSKLTQNSEKETVMTAKEGYKALLELTELKNDDVRAKATVTLAILAEQPDCQDPILEATNGWNKIFAWLNSSCLGVQQGALQLCASLVINEELREGFIKDGGVREVLRAMGATDLKVQRALATCLANVAQEGDVVKDVISGEGLRKILSWIAIGDEELTGSAISLVANISNNDELKSALISGNVLGVVPPLLVPENDIIRTGALIVCANLSTQEEASAQIVNTLLDGLLEIGKSNNGDHVYRVAVTLNNLSQYDGVKDALRSKAGRLLQTLAESEDKEVRNEATEALAELGMEVRGARIRRSGAGSSGDIGTSGGPSGGDDDDAFWEEEGKKEAALSGSAGGAKEREEIRNNIKNIIERLADRATSPDDAERLSNELYQYCLRRENHVAVNAAGGIPVIIEFIKRNDEMTPARINCIRTLAELAKNSKNRNRIGGSGGILAVSKFLKGTQYNHVLLAVLVILDQLTQSDSLLDQLRAAKPIPELVTQASNSTNEEIQTLALRVIYRVVFNHVASQVAFRFADGFDMAIKYLQSPHARVREQAAYALGGACVSNRKMQQHIRKVKTFKQLAKLLDPKEAVSTRLAGVTSFSYIIALDQNNQEMLRKISGAIDNVIGNIRVIPSGSGSGPDQSQVQELHQNSVNLLSNLCYLNSKVQTALRNKKAIPCFTAYLTSNESFVTTSIKEQATRGLCYICFYNNKNQEIVATPNVISALVAQLSSPSKRLQYYTEGLIWSLAQGSKTRRAALLDAGAFGPLLELAKSPSEAIAKGAEWAKQALTKK